MRLRLAKPLAEALALLPFLRQRQRNRGDAVTMFGWGMASGLGVVTAIVVVERILFAGIFDFSTALSRRRSVLQHARRWRAYRRLCRDGIAVLADAWSSCAHAGWARSLAAARVPLRRIYAVVTFARAAYAACLVGLAVTAIGAGSGWRSAPTFALAAVGVVPIVLLAVACSRPPALPACMPASPPARWTCSPARTTGATG